MNFQKIIFLIQMKKFISNVIIHVKNVKIQEMKRIIIVRNVKIILYLLMKVLQLKIIVMKSVFTIIILMII